MRSFIIACVLFLFLACKNNLPSDVITPGQMQPIVFDLIKAGVFVDNYVLKDTTLKSKSQHTRMYEQIFSIHKVSKKQFYSSLDYYQKHPDLNKALFDSIAALASRQKDAMYKTKHAMPGSEKPLKK